VLCPHFGDGCYTNLRVNLGNGTGQRIDVRDTQTGQEVAVAPGKFRKLSHSQARLVVTTPDKTRYQFIGQMRNVECLDVTPNLF
jgi:hypothetical protein